MNEEDELKILEELYQFLFWFDYRYDPIGGSGERSKDWIDYLDGSIEVLKEKLSS